MANHPLVIIDSDLKAKTLGAQYESPIDTLLVSAPPMKAVYKSPEDKLKRAKPLFDVAPIDSEKNFVEQLLDSLDRDIYLALDCDQRGEYWSWLISEFLINASKGTKIPKRLHLIGLNENALHESFRLVEPVESDRAISFYVKSLFNSYLTKHLKRLLGTSAGPKNLPLNYYSLTTLFLLAERESEIQAFTPILKWQVKVKLAAPDGEFDARLEEAYEISDDGFLKDASEGKEVVNLLKEKTFTAHQVDREEISIAPPLPYRTAELLQDAFILYGMGPKKTLEAAQQLFAGVEINAELTGLITSIVPMEHSSPAGLVEGIRQQIVATHGEDALGEASELEGGADYILPIRPDLTKEALKDILNKEACDVYGLIWARAMANQMKEAVGESIEVEIRASDDFIFLASARSITEKGFLSTYYGYHDRELLKPSPLANIEEGQTLENLQIAPEQTLGFPPEFYTYDSLFADLADLSITLEPSTILMLQSMIDNGYLSVTQEGCLRCKENTAKVIKTLNRALPSMPGINLSSYFAQTVEEVVSGRKSLDFALQQFNQTLMMQGNVLVQVAMPTAIKPRARTSQRIIKAPDEAVAQPVPIRKDPTSIEPAAVDTETAKVDKELIEEATPPAASEAQPEAIEEAAAAPSEEAAAEEVPVEERADAEMAETADQVVAEEEQAPANEAETLAPDEEIIPETLEAAEEMAAEESQEAQEVFDQPHEEPQETVEPAAPAGAEPDTGREAEHKVPAKSCPDCSRPLLLKEDRFGKYWYCSGHPACRHSESFDKEAGPEMDCPLCDIGKVITKRTPTGKLFYVCPEHDCEFMAWAQPHAIPCQACNSPFLVEKKSISGKRYLRCPRAGCNYMQPLSGSGGLEPGIDAPKKKLVRVRRKGGKAGGKGRKVRVVRRKK